MSGLEGVTIRADVREGPNHPVCKVVRASSKVLGRSWRSPKNGFVKKTLFTHSRECEDSKEGQDPTEMTRQRGNFKVNDLVLVRDPTSGAFAPCYMPNYRIVAMHGPNRITVRDEKGNETVRRASHLKVCDWKEKVISMVPDPGEYNRFGRSTKLLIHPKDIPDVQFGREADTKSEISPGAENSMIEVKVTSGREEYGEILPEQLPIKAYSDASANNEISVEIIDLREERGEFLPKVQNPVEKQLVNLDKQYIADSMGECINDGSNGGSQLDDKGNRNRWFFSSVDCVSKWSKALKQGVSNSMGLERLHTASTTTGESEKPDFSFFL